jgi:putative transposase
MPKTSRFTDEQIIRTLKELEAGAQIDEVSRRLGVTKTTLYRWKAKYGGLELSEAKRLKALDDENRRLKRMVADLSLDNQALKDLLTKKW